MKIAENTHLFTISISIGVYIAIYSIGITLLPDDFNALCLLSIVSLAVSSLIIVSKYPRILSFNFPVFSEIALALICSFVVRIIMNYWPLNIKYVKYFFAYDITGRFIYVVLLCILIPVVEEIYFRGLLFTIISERFGVTVGAILSVILFVLYHMTTNGILALILLSGICIWLVHRTGKIIPSILAHISYNAIWLIHGLMRS